MSATRSIFGALCAALLAAGLGACASALQPEDGGASPTRRVIDPMLTRRNPSAGVLVVRRDQVEFGWACVHRIFLDHSPVADLRPNEMVTIYAPPGDHAIGLKPTDPSCSGETELMASLERGKPRRFATTVSAAGHARLVSSD